MQTLTVVIHTFNVVCKRFS